MRVKTTRYSLRRLILNNAFVMPLEHADEEELFANIARGSYILCQSAVLLNNIIASFWLGRHIIKNNLNLLRKVAVKLHVCYILLTEMSDEELCFATNSGG